MAKPLHLLHPTLERIVIVRASTAAVLLKYGYELISETRSDELIYTYTRKDKDNAYHRNHIQAHDHGATQTV